MSCAHWPGRVVRCQSKGAVATPKKPLHTTTLVAVVEANLSRSSPSLEGGGHVRRTQDRA